MKKSVGLLVSAATLFIPLRAQVLPQVAPQEVGLSSARLDRIRTVIEKHIAENHMSGAIGLIARRGKIAYFETYGMADKEAGKPIRKDSIFRIYSMTKAVTGVGVMILYEEGRFTLTDPVSKYLPEFENMKVAVEKTDPVTAKRISYVVPAERQITILDLLRHTSGLNYAGPRDEKGDLIYPKLGIEAGGGEFPLAEMVKRLSQTPLVHQPGTIWDYGFSIDVLGRLVEVVSGQTLDQFFAERIFKPLRMEDTGFYVPEEKWGRLAALYQANPDGTVRRSTGPAQESFKKKPILFLGGAGLTSTAMDYARFVQMLLNGGALDGARILSPKTVDLMRSDTLGDLPRVGPLLRMGDGFGLTFAVTLRPGRSGSIVSEGEYRWGGAAGTAFWIDPREKIIGVFMMQTLVDLAKGIQFQQLAYQAIVDEEK